MSLIHCIKKKKQKGKPNIQEKKKEKKTTRIINICILFFFLQKKTNILNYREFKQTFTASDLNSTQLLMKPVMGARGQITENK